MAYATHDDLVDQYGDAFVVLSFDKDLDGAVDTDVETKALDDATAEIDSYIAARFSLPLASPVPEILTRICGDIAIYRGSGEAGTVTDEKRLRYEDAVKWLDKLAAGTVGLGSSVAEPQSVTSTPIYSSPNTREFTRAKFGGW
jgi:phage gp36-like protein